jgi:hypothetical protein
VGACSTAAPGRLVAQHLRGGVTGGLVLEALGVLEEPGEARQDFVVALHLAVFTRAVVAVVLREVGRRVLLGAAHRHSAAHAHLGIVF